VHADFDYAFRLIEEANWDWLSDLSKLMSMRPGAGAWPVSRKLGITE